MTSKIHWHNVIDLGGPDEVGRLASKYGLIAQCLDRSSISEYGFVVRGDPVWGHIKINVAYDEGILKAVDNWRWHNVTGDVNAVVAGLEVAGDVVPITYYNFGQYSVMNGDFTVKWDNYERILDWRGTCEMYNELVSSGYLKIPAMESPVERLVSIHNELIRL